MPEESPSNWKRLQVPKGSGGKLKKRFRKMETSSLKHARTFIVHRWDNVREVRRHAFAWMLLVGLLIAGASWQSVDFGQKVYNRMAAAEGTAFSEGMTGTLDTLNPIFATSLAERSASKLIFSGLLRYDMRNELSNDMAESWRYEEGGKRIVVVLRPNLRWHDGAPVTAKDVVYTVDAIKSTDTRSPLLASWRNVTVKAVDDRTINFELPSIYAPFIHSLTVGILPEHLLGSLSKTELRNTSFNRAPVGSGPFIFRDIKTLTNAKSHVVLNLAANNDYYLGEVKLSRFYLHAFADADGLRRSYATDEINAAVNLSTQDISALPQVKQEKVIDAPLYNGAYAFFRLSNTTLQDPMVRQALRLATDRTAIIKRLDDRVRLLEGPLLNSQLQISADQSGGFKQPGYNQAEAEKLLDQAGWVKDASGKRSKAGVPLELNVATVRSGDYPVVLEEIARQWSKIGVTVQTQLVLPDEFQQNVLSPRAYDVLVYELAIGRDPDVFAYWHSSQAGQRGLNLSEYKSGKVDDALDSARTRLEPELRDAKYKVFYQQWLADVPAVALYQPTLHYAASPSSTTLRSRPIIDAVDRYTNVRYWSSSFEVVRNTP
jgi:peptide/nickel transport system substrate-binding protein